MFVQEEKIFAGKVLKIHICTMDGTEWLEEVTEDTTIEKLKEKCLKQVGCGVVDGVSLVGFFYPVTSAWDVCSPLCLLYTVSVSVAGFYL